MAAYYDNDAYDVTAPHVYYFNPHVPEAGPILCPNGRISACQRCVDSPSKQTAMGNFSSLI